MLVSPQPALLGDVTPNLRGFGGKWHDTRIHSRCFFHGPIEHEDLATMSIVESEVHADFSGSHEVTHEVLRLDFPKWLPRDERAVYRWKEDRWSVSDVEQQRQRIIERVPMRLRPWLVAEPYQSK